MPSFTPAGPAPGRTCVVLVTHFSDPAIRRAVERLRSEAPADHDVFVLLNRDEAGALPAGELGTDRLVRLSPADLLALPYPAKCDPKGWRIEGNIDLAFIVFRQRFPDYRNYWFIEYDVHYEGNWSRFFEYFRSSPADLIGTSITPVTQVLHKLKVVTYPTLQGPQPGGWTVADMIKAFLPICRISGAAFEAVDAAYRAGANGIYEITLPTMVARSGLTVEDIGGDGPFVRPANRNRFYFANPATFSHSPGTFVFRPPFRRVLPRPNTLWHPVKPADAPVWFPVGATGGSVKRAVSAAKPLVWAIIIRLWFLVRWNRLPEEGAQAH